MVNDLLISIISAILGFVFDIVLGGAWSLVEDIFDGPDGPLD